MHLASKFITQSGTSVGKQKFLLQECDAIQGHPMFEKVSILSPLSPFPNKAYLGAGSVKAFWYVSWEVTSLLLAMASPPRCLAQRAACRPAVGVMQARGTWKLGTVPSLNWFLP